MSMANFTTYIHARRAFVRHKKKAILCFLVLAGAGIMAAVLLPKKYHSEGKLLVRLGRENATLDSTATLSQDPVVSVPQSRENEINSVVEVLRSRAVAERVVDALGPEFILSDSSNSVEAVEDDAAATDSDARSDGARQRAVDALAAVRDWLDRAEGGDTLSARDRALSVLLKRYSVKPARKSNIIAIDCQGPSPQWAQRVVAMFIDVCREEHIRSNRPQGSLEFFTEQAARSQAALTQKEEALRDLKTATGLTSPADQRLALVNRIGRLQDELLQAEGARAVSESKVQALRKQLTGVPEKRVTQETSGIGNEGTDMIRQQLYLLQVRKEEAAAKYTAAHPHMQRLQEQLDAARQIVDRQEPTRTQVTTATNRVHDETRLALMAEEPALASLQSKAATLRQQLAGVRGELDLLNTNELQIGKLQREVELQQATYRKYAANLEQARIDQALELQRMSNLSVVQPATLEPRAVYPRKGVLAGLGILTGLLGGLGVALLADWRDRRLYTAGDIHRRLNVPVLGSMHRLQPQESKLNGNGNGKS